MPEASFEDFLGNVDSKNKDFASEVNSFLLESGCKCNVKSAKSGFTVSYVFSSSKKTLATFICRKSGVKLRIYPQHLEEYESFLSTLPEKMKKEIKKASVCKRLLDPNDCNPKCVMGYDFCLDDERYKKCRYAAFQPTLNQENNVFIKSFLEHELSFFK